MSGVRGMGKRFTILKIMMLTFFTVNCISAAAVDAATPAQTGQQWLRQVNDTLAQLECVHFKIQLKLNSPMGDAVIDASGDLQNSKNGEYLSRLDSETKIQQPAGKATVLKTQQYIQGQKDSMILYQSNGDRWGKSTLMTNPEPLNAKKLLNKYSQAGVFGYKDITVLRQTPNDVALRLVLDNRVIGDTMARLILQSAARQTLNQPAVEPFFAAMPDIVCEVHFDPQTKYVKTISADLSPQVAFSMQAALVGGVAGDAAARKEMLQKMMVTLQGEFSQQNAVPAIAIPAEVIAAAKEQPAAILPRTAAAHEREKAVAAKEIKPGVSKAPTV